MTYSVLVDKSWLLLHYLCYTSASKTTVFTRMQDKVFSLKFGA